jgi:hypothetical protein
MVKQKIGFTKLDYYNINLKSNELRIILIIIVILIITLIFRKSINNLLERIIVFSIIFFLFLIISKNILITIIGTLLIFLIVNLTINYKTTIENFQDMDEKIETKDTKIDSDSIKNIVNELSEPGFTENIFQDDKLNKSKDGIKKLLDQINGGIELKDDDLKETKKLDVDHTPYSDDKNSSPLKKAQKEAFELIDTVSALNDTITSLAPILTEGKKLMGMFQNIQI